MTFCQDLMEQISWLTWVQSTKTPIWVLVCFAVSLPKQYTLGKQGKKKLRFVYSFVFAMKGVSTQFSMSRHPSPG